MKTSSIMALAATCTLAACSYQDSEPESMPETIDLRLEFNSSMIYTGAANSNDGIKAGDGKAYDIRHTVEAWSKDIDGQPTEPCRRIILTKSDIIDPDCDVRLTPEDGSYILYVWTDYVPAGTSSDCFYDTSDLRKITLIGGHKGNNDYLDAFFGHGEITVSHDSEGNPVISGGDITMERAVAKYDFYAFDLSDFVRGLSDDVRDLERCKVTFFYTGRIPSVFNAVTGNTVATRAGVEFSTAVELSDARMTNLGFDYMLTDEDESDISVVVGIFSEDGRLLSTTGHIKIPVERNVHSTVDCTFIQPVDLT